MNKIGRKYYVEIANTNLLFFPPSLNPLKISKALALNGVWKLQNYNQVR